MKSILVVFIAIVMIGLAESCTKCNVCVAKDQDGVARYTYPEVCGSKKDLESYASECTSQYGSFGFSCVCSEP